MTVESILQYVIPAVVGALGSGIPLYVKFRKALVDIKAKEAELADKTKINTEGEWKRILEYRDAELVQLRSKDEQQEKKIETLFNLHVECEKDKVRQDERGKQQNEKIAALEKKLEEKEQPLAKNLELLVALLLEERKQRAVSTGTPAPSIPTGS